MNGSFKTNGASDPAELRKAVKIAESILAEAEAEKKKQNAERKKAAEAAADQKRKQQQKKPAAKAPKKAKTAEQEAEEKVIKFFEAIANYYNNRKREG